MTDSLSLVGKTAIITGSSRHNGIGAGIARLLASKGAAVTINHFSDSTATQAAEVADRIKGSGGKAIVLKGDVRTQQGAKKLVDGTLKGFGVDRIDILVNNAGAGFFVPTVDMTEEQVKSLFEVNVYGPIYLTQQVVPLMPEGGRIINISSVAPKVGLGIGATYSATKGALDAFTLAWAEEFGRSKGITVNSISPGPVMTDIIDPGEKVQALVSRLVNLTRAADRVGTTEDIADAVLLIASEKGRWITGQTISVSGGITN